MARKLQISIGLLIGLLILSPGLALAAITTVPVTSDTGNQGRPDVSGDHIVWKGNQAGNWNIYMKDLSTGAYLDVTINPAYQNLPVTNGSAVVWQDNRNGTWDIYFRTMPGGTEQLLVPGSGNQGLSDISGNMIVYVDNSSGNNDIYAKDLGSGDPIPVCTDPANQWQPRISGNRVVWEDNRNGNWNIYSKTIGDDGDGEPVCAEPDCPATGSRDVADIDGDIVVWRDYRNGRYDIWMKNLDTEAVEQITDDTAYQSSPRVSGDLVVWEDYRNDANNADTYYDYDIYMKDLTSRVESQLAGGTAIQARPAVDRETVVWESDPGTGNYDIWMATVPDEIPPVISSLSPLAGSSLGCAGPATISAGYTDNRAGINTGSAQLLLDGNDVTAGATVSESGIIYHPPNPLNDGPHTVSLNVSDRSGNTASSSWDFSTSSPLLSLSITGSFWASYADYLDHKLSVGYTLANLSTGATARSAAILQSPASNGVIFIDSTTLADDLGPGQTADHIARYSVPETVTFFKATVFAGCEDDCGWVHYFPAPPPSS